MRTRSSSLGRRNRRPLDLGNPDRKLFRKSLLVEPLEARLLLAGPDVFEPNDSFSQAFDLVGSAQTHVNLSIHEANNEDWYKWTATGSELLNVKTQFVHANGDLELELRDSLNNLIVGSYGTSDTENVRTSATSGETYYIRVYGHAGSTNDYSIQIDWPLPIPADYLEPNDSFDEATDLGTFTEELPDLTIHPIPGAEFVSNEDYYRWKAPANGTMFVDAIFVHALGDLDMAVYDSNQVMLGGATSVDDDEYITLSVNFGETYYIHVYGWSGSVNPRYDLSVNFQGNEEFDFGDAPDGPYPTWLNNDGARHLIDLQEPLFLGNSVDSEPDGQPNANATGDELNGPDEDGVFFFTPLTPGELADLEVIANDFGFLQGWVDFNNNGSWADAGEQVFFDEPLNPGANPLGFNVPGGAIPGTTFARFRFSRDRQIQFFGPANDGEVEDYFVEIFANTPPVADPNGPYVGVEGTAVTLDGTGSYDPDASGTLTYQWQQISGPAVIITNETSVTPTISGFTQTSSIQECEFELVVSNGELTSEPDMVKVVIVRVFDDIKNGLRMLTSFDPNKPTIMTVHYSGTSGIRTISLPSEILGAANVIESGYRGDSYQFGDFLMVYLS